MKKNVCLYAMMALAIMGCSQNNKKQEGISKGLPSRVESESKAEKVGQSVVISLLLLERYNPLLLPISERRLWITSLIPKSGYLLVPVLPLSISMPPGVDLAR